MTYGQLKFRLVKAFPGVDVDLIEGWISDRYEEILSELPWTRQNTTAVLQTAAPYSVGTVSLTPDSASVTGTGSAFTSAMTGMAFRVAGEDDIYAFTRTGPTSGTLDRPFEGKGGSGLSYSLFQHIYVMPADCRMLDDSAFSSFSGPLKRMSRSQLNQADPTRIGTGRPQVWTSYMDDGSAPPRIQVELSPIPDKVYGIPYTYNADASLPDSGAAFLAWLNPAALVEGVTAKIKRHLKDYVGAMAHAVEAKAALQNMRTSEAQGMAPVEMQLSPYYTGHRARRWCR